MSRLSELTAKYEKLLEDTYKVRDEIKAALGDVPQAFLSPFGTTSVTTNTTANITPMFQTKTVKFKPIRTKNLHRHNGRSTRVLNSIRKYFGTRSTFRTSALMNRMGCTDSLQKSRNTQAIYTLWRAKKITRVNPGEYKLNKGV